jgi:hypothetical protein
LHLQAFEQAELGGIHPIQFTQMLTIDRTRFAPAVFPASDVLDINANGRATALDTALIDRVYDILLRPAA